MAQGSGRVRVAMATGNAWILLGQQGTIKKVKADETATVAFDWLLMPVTVDRSPSTEPIDADVPLSALEAI